MNVTRIGAIFEKDMKDFLKNPSLFIMPLLPIFLAVLYERIGNGEELPLLMIYIVIGTTYAANASGCLMIMMAEENEKKTLRGLMMSPASIVDIIFGKSLVAVVLTAISLIISLSIFGFTGTNSFQAIIGLIVALLFFILIGIGIGLFAKTIASTQVYMTPILFIFGMTPMIDFLGLDKNSIGLKIAHAFPLPQLMRMNETGSWSHLGIVGIWVIGAAIFAYIFFNRTRRDR